MVARVRNREPHPLRWSPPAIARLVALAGSGLFVGSVILFGVVVADKPALMEAVLTGHSGRITTDLALLTVASGTAITAGVCAVMALWKAGGTWLTVCTIRWSL